MHLPQSSVFKHLFRGWFGHIRWCVLQYTPSLAWRHPPLDLPGQPWLNVLVVPFAIVGYIDWKFTGNVKYV